MSYDLNVVAAKTKSPPLIFCLHRASRQSQASQLLIKAETRTAIATLASLGSEQPTCGMSWLRSEAGFLRGLGL